MRQSVSFQKRMIEQFVASYGGGYDADSVEQPALRRLLTATQSGERAFDVVLVYSQSKECPEIEVDTSITGQRVVRDLNRNLSLTMV